MLMVIDRYPLLVTMILIAIGALGFLSVRFWLMLINQKRAGTILSWTADEFDEEMSSEERRGDQKLTFRYGY